MGNKVAYYTLRGERAGVRYTCPGCGYVHALPTGPDAPRPRWSFNGDLARPTLSPSILATVSGCEPDCDVCDEGLHFQSETCHHFVQDGRIQFLSDSTHALAGQTVDLPDIETA
ncbi:MAG TPA: DUF6527 family protein [Rhizobacter sp.]